MKKLIGTLLLILGYLATIAQPFERDNKQIIIAGKISDSMMDLISKAPYITIYTNYNEFDPSSKQTIPLNIVAGKFSIKITPNDDISYFDLGDGMIRSVTNDVFLISQGDSIYMNIKNKNDVSFTGKGSEKLNYQNWAGKLVFSDMKYWGPDDKAEEMMKYYKKRSIRLMAFTLDSLNKDTSITDVSIKNLLRLNTSSSISKQYLNNITAYTAFSDTAYFNYLKEEINFLITQQNGFVESDPYLLKNSFMYVQYLFELNETIAMIKTKSDKKPISTVFNNIKMEYNGLLRDKLLPYCFLDIFFNKNTDAMEYLPKALTIVKDSSSKAILKQVEKAKLPGVKAYNFRLETLGGKQIKLDDYKGKIVVLETYYRGCVPCRVLSIHMEPIAKHFIKNKDVVFINMDGVAKDYKTFEKGAISGEYGSKQTIYAWTGGLGEQHPLLLYYQYAGFPNLLIIGKDGNIISANPSRPLDDSTKALFISLIEKNL